MNRISCAICGPGFEPGIQIFRVRGVPHRRCRICDRSSTPASPPSATKRAGTGTVLQRAGLVAVDERPIRHEFEDGTHRQVRRSHRCPRFAVVQLSLPSSAEAVQRVAEVRCAAVGGLLQLAQGGVCAPAGMFPPACTVQEKGLHGRAVGPLGGQCAVVAGGPRPGSARPSGSRRVTGASRPQARQTYNGGHRAGRPTPDGDRYHVLTRDPLIGGSTTVTSPARLTVPAPAVRESALGRSVAGSPGQGRPAAHPFHRMGGRSGQSPGFWVGQETEPGAAPLVKSRRATPRWEDLSGIRYR